MEKICSYIKSQQWFKIGKWKEPLFLQDSVVRAYLNQKKDQALPFYPKEYFVAGFKQFISQKEYESLKKKLEAVLISKPLIILNQIRNEVSEAIRNINSFKPRELTKSTIKKYSQLVEVHARQSLRFIIIGYVLEKIYPRLLPSNVKIKGKLFTPQALLATGALPKKMVPMIKEHLDLLKIAQMLKENKDVNKNLLKHVKKFGWMNSLCWWDEPFDSRYYLREAEKQSKKNPKRIIKRILSERKEQYLKANELLQFLKINYPQAWQYIDLIREMTDMREESWDAVSRAGQRLRPLFNKLANKNNITYNQLLSLSVNEMISLSQGKIKVSVKDLNSRLQCFALYSTTKTLEKPQIYSGKAAVELARMAEKEKGNFSQLKGLIIWPGKEKGRVCVMESADEIGKIKAGEILVCPMTDPDYMPAIKKAKALVTDQGGVLCHAAIVARELKKVCLVGTQNATKVFKTGDLAEVDANKGLVRKIK
ncbi:hypothetical protein C4569_02015 [Candidatus Parcubacteria bacterium]|nr:MAG: hypothetical protein C4569_02015 [Candidatus Parcubacteria bacterium]